MEADTERYSLKNLENYSYRYLQQMAKSMNLPSNVKKKYLIELINAYKFKSQKDLDDIIHRVKQERKQLSNKRKVKVNKSRVQASEITSTSNSSPPISQTPNRRSFIKTRSPDRTVVKSNSEHRPYSNSLTTYASSSQLNRSDRVLRSFRDRPNYRIMNMRNAMLGVIKAQSPKATKINIMSQGGSRLKINLTVFEKKPNNEPLNKENQLVPYPGTLPTKTPTRQRKISGISPLKTPEPPRKIFTSTVQFARKDGRMSTIHALVQKQLPPQICYREKNHVTVQNATYTIQEQVTAQSILTECETPNCMTTLAQLEIQDKFETSNPTVNIIERGQDIRANVDERTEYLHKKIRAEHVRTMKVTQVSTVEERLPCISDVFSKFTDINLRNLMQPLHVEVSEESERSANIPIYTPRVNAPQNSLLECIYNFRTQFMTNQPLLQIAPAANTKCVYSTRTISSVMQQSTTPMIVNDYTASYVQDDPYENIMAMPHVNDFVRVESNTLYKRDFTCNEVLSPSSRSSVGSSQDLGANVTIPEMVEDALELISQDGDYMERIGMDGRMQCFFCDWAGPKFILEHHIRKEHGALSRAGGVWAVRVSLGSLGSAGSRRWERRALCAGAGLLLLSATCPDNQHFVAALHTLSCDEEAPKYGKITIYNKVTGEPYTWEGEVHEITDTMPSEDDTDCFKIELSKINLLPNSANLMLINRELVMRSPGKVVVGSHALNDINIVMYVECY